MTALEKAARAARSEVGKLRNNRVPEYPGSWKTYEGLGYENLDEVAAAVARAVLMAVREPDAQTLQAGDIAASSFADQEEDYATPAMVCGAFTAMIDAILAEEPK